MADREDLIKTTQQFDAGDALVELYVIDYKDTKYYVQGVHSSPINFRDADGKERTYISVPLKMSGIEHTSDGASIRPTLSVASRLFGAFNLTAEDLIGARITRRSTLKKLLTENPPVEYPIQKFIVDRVSGSSRLVTEFELSTPFDLSGATLPKRSIIGYFCPWEYQGADRRSKGGCSWLLNNTRPGDSTEVFVDRKDNEITGFTTFSSGTTYEKGDLVKYDDGNLTTIYKAVVSTTSTPSIEGTDWVREEMCGKRLSSCKARFQKSDPNAILPFGGFPGSRKYR